MSEVVILQPDPTVDAGLIPQWLKQCGHRASLTLLTDSTSVPTLEHCPGPIIILGGTMSAHHHSPWMSPLRSLIVEAVESSHPVLGICLGAQIAAEALGGSTRVPALGMGEEGLTELILTSQALNDPLAGPACLAAQRTAQHLHSPWTVPVSHHDAVTTLPAQAVLLASSPTCPIHMWRAGSLLAVQHHPEASPQTTHRWFTEEARSQGLNTATDHEASDRILKQAHATAPCNEAFGTTLLSTLTTAYRCHHEPTNHGLDRSCPR